MQRSVGRSLLGLLACLAPGAAFADRPVPWQMWFQDPATPVADRLQDLHFWVVVVITFITIFVMGLLAWVCFRYRAKAHPVPTRTTHNTVIEIAWTVIPIVILLCIAVPSLSLIYFQERIPKDVALTLKVTGIQWYWHYDYIDNGGFGFDSQRKDDSKLSDPSLRLLDVDNEVVLPVGENIRVQIAGNDVMHSWFVPSLAVQKYAVVGRLNEVWINIEREGTYFGECNQICGINHAFMPIKIHAVSKEAFAAWVEDAKKKFAQDGAQRPQLADATPAH
ncbi:MAG TPA: cytochrome c oxidase subunit II [Stellaceae bacterium]|nr:cytochrome c oxidase subunit II [Stellaceae bacterium]